MNLGKAIDLTGQKFGKLTVLVPAYIKEIGKYKKKRLYWKCRCDCGNITYAMGQSLRNGNTKSCGCLKKENSVVTRIKFNTFEQFGDLIKGYDDKGNYFIIDAEDLERVKKYYWSLDGKEYWRTQIWENGAPHYQSLHRFLIEPSEDKVIDHIDRNKNNNSKNNLRICEQRENSRNVSLGSKNTSGFLGVSWNKNNKNWNAYIKLNGKRKYLGAFSSKEEAIKARLIAEKEMFGEYSPQKNLFKEYGIEDD